MKKIAVLIALTILLFSCENDDNETAPENTSVNFRFTQNWDGQEIENSDYENTTYVNANGESLTLSKVNDRISDITFT